MKHAYSRLPYEDMYVVDRWIRCYDRDFRLPIGEMAIERYEPLRNGAIAHEKEQQKLLALLPGNEFLYAVVPCRINATFCELLFLVDLVEQTKHEGIVVTPTTGRPRLLPEAIFTVPTWGAGKVAYRITGYPEDPAVATLMDRARKWWAKFQGKPLPVFKGGRPEIPLDYETAAHHWQALLDQYESEQWERKRPSTKEFLDYLKSQELFVERSTWYSRRRKWEQDGHERPPPPEE